MYKRLILNTKKSKTHLVFYLIEIGIYIMVKP